MADSSMRGGGRAGPGPGRAGPGAELRGRGCGARCSDRWGPSHPRPGAHAHAHARTPPRAPSRRRRSIFEPAQRFPRRARAGERARGAGAERGLGSRRAGHAPSSSAPPPAWSRPLWSSAPPGPSVAHGSRDPLARGTYLAPAPVGAGVGRDLNTQTRFLKSSR